MISSKTRRSAKMGWTMCPKQAPKSRCAYVSDGGDFYVRVGAKLITAGDHYICEHRLPRSGFHSNATSPTILEWSPGDDLLSNSEFSSDRLPKRRRSGDHASESFSVRLSRRLPSLSRRWKDSKLTTSIFHTNVHSAPASRASSLRLPSLRRSLATHVDHIPTSTPSFPTAASEPDVDGPHQPRGVSCPGKPLDITVPRPEEDPINRHELASTPLLPPMMDEHHNCSTEALQSPLPSPSVANPSTVPSLVGTPKLLPSAGAIPSPPLSSQPSIGSFHGNRSGHTLYSTSEIPSVAIAEEFDPWAEKLGHANFHIQPEPYLPEVFTIQTCNQLLNDWENARKDYMRQAKHIGENYGPTSQICKYTEAKWREIDNRWRAYHERATKGAAASGGVGPYHRTLAETPVLSKMPSLNDPENPGKFPKIEDEDIVGPMVKFTTDMQRFQSKRPAFLKLLTDPASLLGSRSPFRFKR